MMDDWGISCQIALRWMSQDLTDYKSTLVQVMAWCWEAISHYLSQCWFRCYSATTCLKLIEAEWRLYDNLTTNGSDNGLSPDRRQAIISTNAKMLLTGPLRTKFCGILIEIGIFSFKKMHLKMLFGKCQPFCLCLNELTLTAHWYKSMG